MSSLPSVHLLRTAAGIDSIDHLYDVQSRLRMTVIDSDGEAPRKAVTIHTKRKPQRAEELINGGSVYWIIKHMIKARQEIYDIEILSDESGQDVCRIFLNPEIMITHGISHRAIQGWRYFTPEKAPDDMRLYDPALGDDASELPEEMAKELRELCLI